MKTQNTCSGFALLTIHMALDTRPAMNDRPGRNYDGNNGVPQYIRARHNNPAEVNALTLLPRDGTCAWETPSAATSVIRYTEGPKDRAWMAEQDRIYVFRLLREGTLNSIEPNLKTEVPGLFTEVEAARQLLATEAAFVANPLHKFLSLIEQGSIDKLDLTEIPQEISRRYAELRSSASPYVAKNLARLPQQMALDLSHLRLRPAELLSALAHNPAIKTLKTLNLSGVQLTDEMGRMLLTIIKQNHTLTDLDITGTNLRYSIVMQLKIQLRKNAAGRSFTINGQAQSSASQRSSAVATQSAVLPQPSLQPINEEAEMLEIYQCAKCKKIMLNPVMAADGETYEREEIEKWFREHNTSPKTNVVLTSKVLYPNLALQRQIDKFLNAHPELWTTDEIYVSANLEQALIAAVQAKNHIEVTRIIGIDKRLLTRLLVDAQHLLSLSLTSSPEVVQVVLRALGDKFWELPEIEKDEGVGFFQVAIHHLDTAGARIIATQLEWQAADIQKQFSAALVAGDLRLISVTLDLGANIEAVAENGAHPLHQAINKAQHDLIKLLIERGADRNARDKDGNTALHLAVIKNDAAAANVLFTMQPQGKAPVPLSHFIDTLNPQSNCNPLHLALNLNNGSFVQTLLDVGANLEVLQPPENDTALLHAVRRNKPELLALLLANKIRPDLEKVDRAGNTAVHLAFNLEYLDLIPLLIQAGADLEKKDSEGNTALLRAVKAKRLDLVRLMLARPEHPAAIHATNQAWENALHLAAQQGDTPQDQELAMFLLDHGVEGSGFNKQGKKPHEVAFAAGHLRMATAIDGKIFDLRIQQLGMPRSSSSSSSMIPRPPIAGLRQEDTIQFTDLSYGTYLGEGAFSKVFKGTWQKRAVAIKELLAPGLSPKAEEELGREAAVMKQLRHPNILALFGVCVEPGHYSLVMEYMPKGSLFNVLHSAEPLTWTVRWDVALGTARGVAHLHDHNPQILHRDLKSPNVLLDDKCVPKITDFGLAKVRTETRTTLHARAPRSSAGQQAPAPGTLAWMAPELFEPNAAYGRACDLFSFGVILWEIASRQAPWATAASDAFIALWIGQGRREVIPEGTPPSYSALISKCWAQRAEDRPRINVAVQELEQHRHDVVAPQIPEAYLCPITSEIMREPVMDREGHTFEKAAIEEWVRAHYTCPVSRARLELTHLSPNRALRDAIEEFMAVNPALQQTVPGLGQR